MVGPRPASRGGNSLPGSPLRFDSPSCASLSHWWPVVLGSVLIARFLSSPCPGTCFQGSPAWRLPGKAGKESSAGERTGRLPLRPVARSGTRDLSGKAEVEGAGGAPSRASSDGKGTARGPRQVAEGLWCPGPGGGRWALVIAAYLSHNSVTFPKRKHCAQKSPLGR